MSATAGGTRLAGRLVGVGADFFVLESANGRPALVVTAAATSVSSLPEGPPSGFPGGDRRPALNLSLLGALDALSEERSPLAVRAGGITFEGELWSVGEDVVTLRGNGIRRSMVHLASSSLAWCELR